MPLTFEEFEVGQEFVTQGRTITETDLMTYAYLSGDLNPLHTDAEFARRTVWGERLVYGLLVTLISAGLRTRLGLLEGTALALAGLECRFTRPVRIGETITSRVRVAGKRPTRKPDRGIITLSVEVVNQDGDVVQENTVTQIVRRQETTVSNEASDA